MMKGQQLSRLFLRDFDHPLFWSVMALVSIGIAFVYSATVENVQVTAPLHSRQALWALIGLVAILVAIRLPLQFFYSTAYILYGLAILLLVGVLVTGGGGTERWFDLAGVIRLQPSELAKVIMVLAVARYLSGHNVNFRRIRDFLIPLGLAVLPFLLVARQPDLGTSVVFLAILLPMLYWKGVPVWVLFLICSPLLSIVTAFSPYTWGLTLIAVGVVVWKSRLQRGLALLVVTVNVVLGAITPTVWDSLHEYQQQRILNFIDPQQDPLGAGYHVIQSTVAVGSGGLIGKGYLHGTQTKLNFLPAQHTDFVFSVIAEETGLVGALIVLLLFMGVLRRCLRAAVEVKNSFAGLVIIGASAVFLTHIVVNIGMALGLLPITGLPLPFVSYGGSHQASMMLLVGIVLSMRMRWMEY